MFLHGLGCMKENFAPLWDAPGLAGAALLAVDLPGHGASHALPPDSWTMQGMAACVEDLLIGQGLAGRRLHLVVHSMGGAVGLLLTQSAELHFASFINVEGNLIASDCGLLSRRTAEMELEEFRGGKFDKLKASAHKSGDQVIRQWAEWMDTCNADALHASARSVVEWSDSGRLLEIFAHLAMPTAYVYGDQSANPDVLARLEAVPKHKVAECGHFVMTEKPAELARIVGAVVADASA